MMHPVSLLSDQTQTHLRSGFGKDDAGQFFSQWLLPFTLELLKTVGGFLQCFSILSKWWRFDSCECGTQRVHQSHYASCK